MLLQKMYRFFFLGGALELIFWSCMGIAMKKRAHGFRMFVLVLLALCRFVSSLILKMIQQLICRSVIVGLFQGSACRFPNAVKCRFHSLPHDIM